MGPTNRLSKAGGRYRHRECGPEFGAAKQEFAEEADINYIMAKYRQTGVLQESASRLPVEFGEDVGFKTYADAHSALETARERFLQLPPEIRLELNNDPGRYREISTEEGWRSVVERIGSRERNRLAAAQKLVAQHAPKVDPKVEPAVKPPATGSQGGTP